MQVSDEDLREFIKLYKEAFGAELSMDEASPMAEKLVVFYERILNHPLPESEDDNDGEAT